MTTYKLHNRFTGKSYSAVLIKETATQVVVKSEKSIEGLTHHRAKKENCSKVFNSESLILIIETITNEDLETALELSEEPETKEESGIMTTSNDQLKNQVLSIVDTIENGKLHCECCGEMLEHDNEQELVSGDTCPNCDSDELRDLSGYDYLNDALDIEYTVNSSKEYLGARVLVAFGGPNIWINTKDCKVEGYWWSDSFTASYSNDELQLDEALQEIFNC